MRNITRISWALAPIAIAAALCLAIGIVQPAHAQSTGTQPVQPAPQPQQPAAQGQPPQAPAPAQNPPPSLAPPISKEEEDAYKAFFDLASGQGPLIISQGEAFLGRYPSSRYRTSVYSRMVNAYLNSGNAAKMIETGEKALAENPDNIDVLADLCTVLPRTVDPRSLDADKKLSQAERYARHVIELIASLQKPGNVTDEHYAAAKNEKLGLAHYGLGLVEYMRGNVSGSVSELELAARFDPSPEPLLFYLLGTGEAKQQKFTDAVADFDHCAKAQWDPQWQARCKKSEEDAKQHASAPAKH